MGARFNAARPARVAGRQPGRSAVPPGGDTASAPSPTSATRTRTRHSSLAVIVPATDRPSTLGRSAEAIRASARAGDEVIVVTEPAGSGPAEARNAGASQASADVLVFVDSDVVVHPDAFARLRAAFDADPGLTAVFGSYDDGPSSLALVSQFRNLLHHHVHHRHAGVAATFWSGLGAVRREEFLSLGGFDTERFPVPAVEDIDLGMRLCSAGGRIELHPKVQGTHLKHWTLAGMVATDFHGRGVPWAALCLERRSLPRTLNLSWRERAGTVATLCALAGAAARNVRLVGRSALVLALLDGSFYALLVRRMGMGRATLALGLHGLHRVVAVVALPWGFASHLGGRRRSGA